ncbi:hypothetical protein NC652_031467 [Populus alba x Populus x berolinensis]|nr:hypothetical protein NC652_031467 [Populus alba x Populus x berolinensis]
MGTTHAPSMEHQVRGAGCWSRETRHGSSCMGHQLRGAGQGVLGTGYQVRGARYRALVKGVRQRELGVGQTKQDTRYQSRERGEKSQGMIEGS